MNTDKHEKEKYITLKEAAKITGYAPDYVGQLIRKGKLPGKQVYCTVAWMTTEEAIRNYMGKDKNVEYVLDRKERMLVQAREFWSRIMLEVKFARLLTTALYIVILFSIGFSFVLFYIFSVSVDKKIEEKAHQKLIENEYKIQDTRY